MEEIRDYYAQDREHERLTRGLGRVEFMRTLDVLTRVLPPPATTVLDVGGGTGVYARELLGRGYNVHFLDAMPGHIERVKADETLADLASVTLGDARALPYPDAGPTILHRVWKRWRWESGKMTMSTKVQFKVAANLLNGYLGMTMPLRAATDGTPLTTRGAYLNDNVVQDITNGGFTRRTAGITAGTLPDVGFELWNTSNAFSVRFDTSPEAVLYISERVDVNGNKLYVCDWPQDSAPHRIASGAIFRRESVFMPRWPE